MRLSKPLISLFFYTKIPLKNKQTTSTYISYLHLSSGSPAPPACAPPSTTFHSQRKMKGGCASQWKAAAGLLLCVMVFASAKRPVFTNNFLVELHEGGEEEARQVAAEHGFGVRKVRSPLHFACCFKTGTQSCAISLQNLQVFSLLRCRHSATGSLTRYCLQRSIPCYVIKTSFKCTSKVINTIYCSSGENRRTPFKQCPAPGLLSEVPSSQGCLGMEG